MLKLYGLLDPDTSELRYIGITKKSLYQRLAEHLAHSKKGESHRVRWIRTLTARGKRPLIELLDEIPDATCEVAAIGVAKSLGCRLTNNTSGGEFATPDEATRQKLREAALRRPKPSKEHMDKMRASIRRGVPRQPLSEATKAKLSAVRRGVPKSPEHVAKVAAALRGKKRPPDAVKKLADMNRGRKRTPEQRERMRQSQLRRYALARSGTVWKEVK